jgi:TPR repeat protein
MKDIYPLSGARTVNRTLVLTAFSVLVSSLLMAQAPAPTPQAASPVMKAEAAAETERMALIAEAEKGSPVAQYRLGMMYYIGNVIPQDYDEAAKWFHLSAEQGYPEGQFRYGCLVYYGRGVEKRDLVQAHMWFNLAAAADYKAADEYREMVAEKMTPKEVSEAQKLAREWKPKAK